MASYRAVAAKVAESKRLHPDQFCPVDRCLWRTGGGRCPRHPASGAAATMTRPTPGARVSYTRRGKPGYPADAPTYTGYVLRGPCPTDFGCTYVHVSCDQNGAIHHVPPDLIHVVPERPCPVQGCGRIVGDCPHAKEPRA